MYAEVKNTGSTCYCSTFPFVPLMALQPYPSFRGPKACLSLGTAISPQKSPIRLIGYARTLCASVKMKPSSGEIGVYGHKAYLQKWAVLIRDPEKDMLRKDIAREMVWRNSKFQNQCRGRGEYIYTHGI